MISTISDSSIVPGTRYILIYTCCDGTEQTHKFRWNQCKTNIGEEKIKDKKERQNIFVLGWLRVGYPARGQFIENIMEIKSQ